jgi:DMSO/TMAO reductase YedYZ molybdopterin-dependent catalytic subunit
MGFFERNREEVMRRGYDPARIPPGQYFTDRFPVLHAGDVPEYRDLSAWDFRVVGLVSPELRLTWDELRALPETEVTADIHCVTKWSKFDTVWRGVRVRDLLARVTVDPAARFAVAHAEFGFTTNLPLDDVTGDDALLAWSYGGEALEPDHGYPLRLVVPHLYFWKSAKWVRGLELTADDEPGFWERNGYHMYGDPWREQRYWGD